MNRFFKNRLISGSLLMFTGNAVGNLGSYFYHVMMGRLLGPANYGVLVSLISLIYLLSVFPATLETVVVRFASVMKAKKKYGQVNSLFREFNQKFFLISLAIFLIAALNYRGIGQFLKTNQYPAIILIATSFLVSFLAPINNGLLRSFLNFKFLAINNILAVILRLGMSYALVKAGLSVFGAVLALVASGFFPYFLSFIPLRFLKKYKPSPFKINWRRVGTYALPVFLVMFSLTSLYTADMILVKHYFGAKEAGLYSALAMLGKIIFFASSIVTMVMFPIVAQKYEKKSGYQKVFFLAFLIVSLISLVLTGFYLIMPKFVIQIVYGPSYFEIASLLGVFGFFISIYSLDVVLTNFFLSIHKTKVVFFSVLAALSQVGLIWRFHQSLLQVIQASLLVVALLLVCLLIYFWQTEMRRAYES